MEINALTGEVTAEIGGKTFRLRANLARLAAYQAALGVTGIRALEMKLNLVDPNAIFLGLKHLCSSDNAEQLEELDGLSSLSDGLDAILAALARSLPAKKKSGKNRKAPAATTPRRGSATAN